MKRKAIVTGGAGFIGSALCRKLSANGYNVVSYDDLSSGSGKISLPKSVKSVIGDILNIRKFKSICKNADVVFNLAVKPLIMSFNNPDEVIKVNEYGTYLIAKTCTELKIKLIHVSSSEVYGTGLILPMKENHPLYPRTIYAGSKAGAELYVGGFEKTYGLKFVIIRPFNSYGEYMRSDSYCATMPRFFNRISRNLPPIIYGTGNQTRDFTHVIDTCEGIFLADQTNNAIGDTINIGQGKESDIKGIAKLMIKKYEDITHKTRTNLLSLTFQKERKGDVIRHVANISHARKVLGYKPKISLEDGISKYIKWRLN